MIRVSCTNDPRHLFNDPRLKCIEARRAVRPAVLRQFQVAEIFAKRFNGLRWLAAVAKK